MGAQKNHLMTVLLSAQNICYKLCVRKYLQFYIENFCLSKPLNDNMIIKRDNRVFLSTKTYVVGTQKNCLNQIVLLITQKLCLDKVIRI